MAIMFFRPIGAKEGGHLFTGGSRLRQIHFRPLGTVMG